MTSASGTTPFLATTAQYVNGPAGVASAAQRALRSEPSQRVMEPVVSGAPARAVGPQGAPARAAVANPSAGAEGPSVGATPVVDAGGAPRTAERGEGAREGGRAPSGGGSFEGVRSESELSPEEQKQVEELKKRDQEVRTHEAAHKAAGGQYVRGGASFDYQSGPDGKRYAIGGEVKIDTGEVKGDPEKTIEKAETIRRAAMAPAEPSDKDRQVAAEAARMAAEARMELARERSSGGDEEETGGAIGGSAGAGDASETGRPGSDRGLASGVPSAARDASASGSSPAVGYAAGNALGQFAGIAQAGRSTNLFVNVYA